MTSNIQKSEVPQSVFCPRSGDWFKLGIQNAVQCHGYTFYRFWVIKVITPPSCTHTHTHTHTQHTHTHTHTHTHRLGLMQFFFYKSLLGQDENLMFFSTIKKVKKMPF